MQLEKVIKKILDTILTADNKWTWYDDYFEKKNVRNLEEWKNNLENGKKSFTKFYYENEARFMSIKNKLADEKSKTVFNQIIQYRMTHEWKNHPGKERNQYFPQDLIRIREDEVFIDCGGYIGDTVQDFVRLSSGRYRKIVTFEPDYMLKEVIQKNTKDFHDVYLIEKGVSDKSGYVYFNADGSSGGNIISEFQAEGKNIVKIPVASLDDTPECHDATFIKMDIEGSEWEALHGAEKIIKSNKPVLAICIYHKYEDLFRIIEYILEIEPQYKVYVRHHSKDTTETVAYFISMDR